MKISIKLFSAVILVAVLFVGMVSGNAKMYMNPLATAFGSGMNSGWFHSAKPHKLLGFDFGLRAMAVTFPDDQKVFGFDISQLEDYSFSYDIPSSSYQINLSAADLYPNTEVPTILGKNESVDVRADKDQLVQIITDQLVEQGATDAALALISQDIDNAAEGALNAVPPLLLSGTGLEALPLLIPQAAVGLSLPMLPIKAEIVVRGLPEIEISPLFQFPCFR